MALPHTVPLIGLVLFLSGSTCVLQRSLESELGELQFGISFLGPALGMGIRKLWDAAHWEG